MHVVDLLGRCADLAARTAAIYRSLAERFADEPAQVPLWRELALSEEIHADVLRREKGTLQEQDESGPFLPEFVPRLDRLEREVQRLEGMAPGVRSLDEALTVAVALGEATLVDLYDDLVLQGDPGFRLIVERLEAALSNFPQSTPRTFRRPTGPGGASS